MEKNNWKECCQHISNSELLSGTISSPWKQQLENPIKLSLRPLIVKGQFVYQVTFHYKEKTTHLNLLPAKCVELIEQSIPERFRQGIFQTKSGSFHILTNRKKEVTTLYKPTTSSTISTLPLEHNTKKNYLFPEGTPIPFLVATGIMGPTGIVTPKKYDKFRQINRFIEIVDDIISFLPDNKTIEIIDFGCGKAYLTFALQYYLKHIAQRQAHITGLDLKKDVVERCQKLADTLNCTNLIFSVGDINNHQHHSKIDLVVSLHACDTATDAALEKSVTWDADVILCVPCCQHELYHQIENPELSTLLRHGILRERFAALATDAARAELLTTVGYDVQILEFIDLEHTPKNLLLRAIKKPSKNREELALNRYHNFKKALQISPFLENKLLKKTGNTE